jgi:hypothetical protein
MKDLLSTLIDILVQDSDEVKHLFEETKPQLPEVLQIKLWPAGHLPFFRAKVEKARRRIEARHSQASLKADIAKRCRVVNDKKAALDAKTDTSASTQRLELLERELEDLKERVRATAYSGREKSHNQLQAGSRGLDHPAEDRACRVERLELTDSVG